MRYSFSVIMPIKNGEKEMCRQLEALHNQTYAEWDVVCCDGGSSDRTLEILRTYNIRPIAFSNTSSANGVAQCVPYCTGDIFYIACHDDEIASPDTFEYVNKIFNENPEVEWLYSPSPVYHEGQFCGFMGLKNNQTLESQLIENDICGTTAFVKRSLVDRLGYLTDEFPCANDYDAWCRYLLHGIKPHWVGRPLARTHRRDLSVSCSPQCEKDLIAVKEKYRLRLALQERSYKIVGRVPQGGFDVPDVMWPTPTINWRRPCE